MSDTANAETHSTPKTDDAKPDTSGLSVRSKLLLMLLASTLVTIGVIGYMGNRAGKNALTEAFSARLESIRNTKREQIETYFKGHRDAFGLLGTDVSVVAAMNSFKQGVRLLEQAGPTPPDRIARLEKFYKEKFLPEARKRENRELRVEEFLPATSVAQKLQASYISDNKFKLGEKDRLNSAPDPNNYNLTHGVYHEWFRDVAKRLEFYDIFLIDPDGRIVYSVFKEVDFGTDLHRGPYRDSGIGRLFRDIMKEKKKGEVKIVDYSFYPPSYYGAAAFIGVPVYSNWKFQGVIIAQLSVDRINSVMSNGFNWQGEGLGETGEAFLVGDDFLMRSDARKRHENQAQFLAGLRSIETPTETLKHIETRKSAILLQRVGSEQVKTALEGKRGTKRVEGYLGKAVLSSYSPLNIPGLNWALVAEINEDEALFAQKQLAKNTLLVACLLSLLTTIGAIYAASRFLAPVNELVGGISRLKKGDADAKIAKLSNDEFGELTDAFNDMTTEIKDRNAVIQNKSRAYEALLRSIFPDAVADRLKAGDSQIVETVNEATVVYLTLHGFTAATEEMDGPEAIKVLNELVDMIDLEAEKQGVEKVKTMGEHYLAVCGLSTPRLDHVERSLRFVEAVSDELELFNKQHDLSLSMRAGIASGTVRAGIVGQKRFVYDVWGRPANIARRIVYTAKRNSVRVTEEVNDQLRSPEQFKSKDVVETQTMGTIKTYEMDLLGDQRMTPPTVSHRSAGKSSGSDASAKPAAVQQKT